MLEIFQRNVERIRKGSDGEYIGLCPFHNDTKPSFSFNEDGVFFCHSCEVKGNIRKFAEMIGEEAPDLGYKPVYKPKKAWEHPKPLDPHRWFDVLNQAVDNLLFNYDDIVGDLPWDKGIVKKLFIGYDDDTFLFPYFNHEGRLVNIKWHKKRQIKGHATTYIYPLWHMLRKYRGDKTLYIVEGEKDCVSMISSSKQAISFSIGANCTPADELLGMVTSKFSDISVIFDKDEAGKRAEDKMIGLLNGEG